MQGPNGEIRPRDVVGNAVHCCRVLVGDSEETYAEPKRNGGTERAKALTPERRSEIAKQAATERWNKPRKFGNVLAIIALAFLVIPASPLGIDIPTVGGEVHADYCEDPTMNDPLAGLSMIFGGIGFVTALALAAFPPVGAFFTLVSLGFAAWSYFGWGGYEPCNA